MAFYYISGKKKMTYLKVLDTSKARYIIKLRVKYTEMYRLHVDAPFTLPRSWQEACIMSITAGCWGSGTDICIMTTYKCCLES